MTAFFVILAALATAPNNPTVVSAGDALVCDFEEAADRDFDGWPDQWIRKRSRELPEFLKIAIVPEPGSSKGADANHCLQVELNGGGAVISSPACAISSQFSLALSLRVKTADLFYDGAWVELTLFDAEGNSLQNYRSQPYSNCPDWQPIHLAAEVGSKATSAVVTLHVQPLGKREDLKGKVWFDDLRIERLPRMQLSASNGTGIFPKRDEAKLICSVSGIKVRNPRVRFELFDETSNLLGESTQALLSTQDAAKWAAKELPPDGYAGQATWVPPFPESTFGFYRARASLLAEDSPDVLLDRTQSLALLRPLPPPTRSQFGWTLPGTEEPLAYGPLAQLLREAGLGWAKMPVWYDPKDTPKADRIAWFAEQLSIQGVELVGMFDQPPPELRALFREQGKLPVASVFVDPELWQPAVGPIMTRLSLKVRWWQLGNDSDVSFVGYPLLESKLNEIKRNLEQYGQQINLGVNWRWIYAPPKSTGQRATPWAYLSYGIDPPLTAEEIAAYLSSPAAAAVESSATIPSARDVAATKNLPAPLRRSGPRRWVHVTPLPRGEYTSDVRVQDLVQRLLATKMNGADAVFLPEPFSNDHGVMNDDGSPGELFVPWRTTAMLVGGTEYLGPLQLPGGSIGHVFARDGRAVMAVWSDRPATERVFLGESVEQIDVWGRGTKPEIDRQDGRLVHVVKIGTMPTFITGLSESVARWQSAVAFENPQLSSVTGREQLLVLRLKNTFTQGVAGELTLHAPKSWGYDPRPYRFKISAGEEQPLLLPVTLMADANSGPQPVRLDFEVGGYRFSVYRTLHLGLDDVQVEMTSQLRKNDRTSKDASDSAGEDAKPDLLVELHLTNLSDRPLSFQCVLFPPDRRRETRQIPNLGRDRTTLTFILPDGEQLIGKKLFLRAEEIGGSRVLNYTLVAER